MVYFRSYYSPDQYKDDSDWDLRLLIEQSKAIKCPSIQYQLAGKLLIPSHVNFNKPKFGYLFHSFVFSYLKCCFIDYFATFFGLENTNCEKCIGLGSSGLSCLLNAGTRYQPLCLRAFLFRHQTKSHTNTKSR